jgi:hypothetical protein
MGHGPPGDLIRLAGGAIYLLLPGAEAFVGPQTLKAHRLPHERCRSADKGSPCLAEAAGVNVLTYRW